MTIEFIEFVVGIDPGLKGGIAIHDFRTNEIKAYPMPTTTVGLDVHFFRRIILQHLQPYDPIKKVANGYCVIEKVSAMPGNGVSSMFKFGFVTGQIHACIRMMSIPLLSVTPQAWKKVVLAGTDKSKDAAITYCLNTFPGVSLKATDRCTTYHDGMADALCIMKYAEEQYHYLLKDG